MADAKTDRRVRRTKALLLQGLMQLMETKDVKDISVKELSDLADINRGTFYKYYADVSDLFSKIELSIVDNVCELIRQSCTEKFSVEEIVSSVLDLTAKNRDFTLMLAMNPTETQYMRKIIQTFRPQFIETIHTHIPGLTEEMADICFDLIAGGVVMLLMRWITREVSLTQAQMKTLLTRYINSALSTEIYTGLDKS